MLSKYLSFAGLCLLLLGSLWLLPGSGGESSPATPATAVPAPQPASLDFAPRVGSLADLFNRAPSQPASVVSLAMRAEGNPDEFLAELDAFAARRAQEMAAPGWLHRLSRHVKLENGRKVHWQVEGWYEFDAAGQLLAAYERILDESGKIVEPIRVVELPKSAPAAILPLAQGDYLPAMAGDQPVRETSAVFDFGFRDFAQKALADGWLFSSQILYENCWYMGETYNLSNGALRVTALYYPDTGKLRTLHVYDVSGPAIVLVAGFELPIEERLARAPVLVP